MKRHSSAMSTAPDLVLSLSTTKSLRAVYLRRLQRLQRLRDKHARDLNPKGLRLLDRALFAAYCSCRDIGIEAEAREALTQRSAVEPSDAQVA